MSSSFDHRPESFFVLRTPALPFDELLAWGEAEQQAARVLLCRWLDDPIVREALHVSSPSLVESLASWRAAPDSKQGRKSERALIRYFQRMAGRPTPFGMLSSCSLGRVDERDCLQIRAFSQARVVANVDLDVLAALVERLEASPQLRPRLRYVANSSLYRVGDRWRLLDTRAQGGAPQLVAIDESPQLDAVIERACDGARVSALLEALHAAEPDIEIDREQARAFIDELIDAQVLRAELGVTLTGPEPLTGLIAALREAEAEPELLAVLERCDAELREIETPGGNLERLRSVSQALASVVPELDARRVLRVTTIRPAPELRLSRALCEELQQGVEVLRRISSSRDPLDRFRAAFSERFGTREVPLTEALDQDLGVGLGDEVDHHAQNTPLLDGLALPRTAPPTEPGATKRDAWLLAAIVELLQRGQQELVLDDAALDALASDEPPTLPDAYSVLATIVGKGVGKGVGEGEDQQLYLGGATGPSGSRLLGRFCDADPALHQAVVDHLRREELLRPDAVFAELVYMDGRGVGNISRRPCLRAYEIPYLGRSGARLERQLGIEDLRVALIGDRIVLRSASLGRELIPRATTAHNRNHPHCMRIYRFLRLLETQGCVGDLAWEWGALASLPFLPRVRFGRVVLARARWRLGRDELAALADSHGTARDELLARWRSERGLPRFVGCRDADNELPVDLDNRLSVDSFAQLVAGRSEATLFELAGAPDRLCVSDESGRAYTHEIIVPFIRPAPTRALAEPVEPRRWPPPMPQPRRYFMPGSEWLTVKLYCGHTLADRILLELVEPWIAEARWQGIERWHFLRYGDPHWHLRVRVCGEPALVHGPLLAALRVASEPFVDRGLIWKVQLDGYERELERYGGPRAIERIEAVFEADSDAALACVAAVEAGAGEDGRWQLALAGVDGLLGDLGLELADKLRLATNLRSAYGREFPADEGELRHQLGRNFRSHRAALEALLDGEADDTLAPGLAAFVQRRAQLEPIATELRRLEKTGSLCRSLTEIAASLVHMHAVRVLGSGPREHELVIHDFLRRLYESRSIRANLDRRVRVRRGA